MIQIRPETQEDFMTIRELLKICFEKKGKECPQQQSGKGTDERLNQWELVEKIRKTESYQPRLSLVAVIDETIVGYIMFSDAWIGGRKTAALAPLAVLPKYRKQGIGGLLVESGLEFVRRRGYLSALVLGGDYYQRFGFRPVSGKVTLQPELDKHLYLYSFLEPVEQEGQIRYCNAFYNEEGSLI